MKVLLTAILTASWLLQSCLSTGTDRASEQGVSCARGGVVPAQPPARIRLGVSGSLAEAASYLAEGEGYFAREGLNVQLINFVAGTRMLPALASGQLDAGSTSIGPGLLNASENNVCVKIVGSLARQEPEANGVFLVARPDLIDSGRLREYADLKGMTIAIPGRDSSSQYALAKLMEAGGRHLDDARVLQMSTPTIMVSLANKSIDAAVLPEGVATAAAGKNLAVKWKPVADVVPGAQFGVLLFSPQFSAQREMAVRFMTAYLQAARDYDAAFFHEVRRPDVVEQMIKASPIKDRPLYDEMSFPRIDPNGRLNLDSIADQMQWLVRSGELQRPVDLSRVIDLSFADAAVDRLGPYPL